MEVALSKRCIAEFFGTFWLVFGGCGAAVLACNFPADGIGFIGVAFAFGLTVLTMAYAIGHISGCHLNPAVTLGLVTGNRFPAKEAIPYWVAQVLGAVVAAGLLYVVASGQPGYVVGGFASNGYGIHSPGGYSLAACLVAEVLLTFFFILVIMGSTDQRAADPPDQHPGHQYVGKPGPLYRPGHHCRRVWRNMGVVAALAVLGSSAARRRSRRPVLQVSSGRARTTAGKGRACHVRSITALQSDRRKAPRACLGGLCRSEKAHIAD